MSLSNAARNEVLICSMKYHFVLIVAAAMRN